MKRRLLNEKEIEEFFQVFGKYEPGHLFRCRCIETPQTDWVDMKDFKEISYYNADGNLITERIIK